MNRTLKLNIEQQNIFFTADTHFGHRNVINFSNRPFKDVYEMNQTLVDNWNDTVSDKDIIFMLGDFSMRLGSGAINHIFYSLRGKKYLILGNHDRNIKQPWEKIDNMINISIRDPELKEPQRITLCHYPMLSWYQSHKGAWQLYGHLHGELSNKTLAEDGFDISKKLTPLQLDVGVDVHNYRPISYQEVKEIIKKQKSL